VAGVCVFSLLTQLKRASVEGGGTVSIPLWPA